MADAFIGEIRIFPYIFNPSGWILCDGRQLLIQVYPALYALIGARFGGDAQRTFNVPNLNGNIPLHMGQAATGTTYQWGQTLGTTTVTLTSSQVTPHSHAMTGLVGSGSPSTTGMTAGPNTQAPLSMLSRAIAPPVPPAQQPRPTAAYSNTAANPPSTTVAMKVDPVGPTGAVAPHENVMLTMVMGYFINFDGIFPERPN
jgi:microcystin-dependent protein